MTTIVNSRIRPAAKFFFQGDRKFFVKGVTYGPFEPNADGDSFPSPKQAEADFQQVSADATRLEARFVALLLRFQ